MVHWVKVCFIVGYSQLPEPVLFPGRLALIFNCVECCKKTDQSISLFDGWVVFCCIDEGVNFMVIFRWGFRNAEKRRSPAEGSSGRYIGDAVSQLFTCKFYVDNFYNLILNSWWVAYCTLEEWLIELLVSDLLDQFRLIIKLFCVKCIPKCRTRQGQAAPHLVDILRTVIRVIYLFISQFKLHASDIDNEEQKQYFHVKSGTLL